MEIQDKKILVSSQLQTPIGWMIAISDESFLYLLQFIDQKDLRKRIEQLKKDYECLILEGTTTIIEQLKSAFDTYFSSHSLFDIPIRLVGSPFEIIVWEQLRKISLGKVVSYSIIANQIGMPKAARAVAKANSKNPIAILIPCHRVIYHNGKIGGYNAGVDRKKWLLQHELANFSSSEEKSEQITKVVIL